VYGNSNSEKKKIGQPDMNVEIEESFVRRKNNAECILKQHKFLEEFVGK